VEVGCNSWNGQAFRPPGTCDTADVEHSYVRTGPLQRGLYFIFVDGYLSSSRGQYHVEVTTTP
jgi:hypothetical protein